MRQPNLPALLILLGTLFLPAIGQTENAPPTSELFLAKSLGIWQQGERFGFFQAFVWREGLEHARDRVEVRILEADAKTGERRLLRRVALPTPDIRGYVQDMDLRMIGNRLFLALDIEMKAMDGAVLREAWLIGPDGRKVRIQEARYRDLGELP